jgi:hypothetical protein
MPTNPLVLEGQTFQIVRRSQVSEAHFRLFLAAIEGATTEIDLESLSGKFQFVELGRHVSEFISQPPHVEVVRLKPACSNWKKRIGGLKKRAKG